MLLLVRILFIFLIITSLSCDTGNLTVVQKLPNTLREISGQDYHGSSPLLWTHNDSNNKAVLYGLDTETGELVELDVDSKNRDWEDMAFDEAGNLFIGDFGNNMNERDNLEVLKINKEQFLSEKEIKPERIKFKYEDQLKFPPDKERLLFDCEAMVIKDGNIFIFTKSHVRGNGGTTSLYSFPAIEGSHIARKISSFEYCSRRDCKITAADFNYNTGELVLLTHQSVLLFSNFDGNDFLSGEMKEYRFDYISQKEGVCFKNDSTLYISDERNGNSGGNLYEFKIR